MFHSSIKQLATDTRNQNRSLLHYICEQENWDDYKKIADITINSKTLSYYDNMFRTALIEKMNQDIINIHSKFTLDDQQRIINSLSAPTIINTNSINYNRQ